MCICIPIFSNISNAQCNSCQDHEYTSEGRIEEHKPLRLTLYPVVVLAGKYSICLVEGFPDRAGSPACGARYDGLAYILQRKEMQDTHR